MYILSRETAVRFMALAAHTVGNDTNPLPILRHVALIFTPNHVQCRAMNMITSVVIDAFAETKFPDTNKSSYFSMLLPHKLLSDLLAKLNGDFITLEPQFNADSEVKSVTISCNTFKGSIPALDGDDFPDVASVYDTNPTTIPSDWIQSIHKKVAFAAAAESDNHILKGVYVYTSQGAIIAAATDGFRMAESRRSLDYDVEPLDVIIPATAFKVLFEAVKSQWFMEHVDIGTTKDGNSVIFQSGDVVIGCRIVNGKYPHYQRFVPDHPQNKTLFTPKTLTLSVPTLKSMIDLAAITAHSDGKMIISLQPNTPNGVTCIIKSGIESQKASGETKTPVSLINNEVLENTLEIALNVKLFADSINACASEDVHVTLFDPSVGVVVETPTWKSVVQPMPL